MKHLKISTAILFIALLGFNSCKKIDPEKELIGIWTNTNEDDVIVEAGALGGFVSEFIKESKFTLPSKIIFNTDKTGTFVAANDSTGTFTYSHTKETIIITFNDFSIRDTPIPPFPITFHYTISKQKKMKLSTDMTIIIKLILQTYEGGMYKHYADLITKFDIVGWYQK